MFPFPLVVASLSRTLEHALGLDLQAKDLHAGQMALRALVVFFFAVFLIRLGNKRFMGKSTALDVLLGVVLGSVISRGITGNAPFGPTLAASATLVAMHWLLSAVASRSRGINEFFMGRAEVIVEEGQLLQSAIRKSHLNEHDLHEAMRQRGQAPSLQKIKRATLERNGKISLELR